MTVVTTPDLAAVKGRQQRMWSSGDFAQIAWGSLAILVLGTYGVLYFVFGAGLGIPEARQILKKFTSLPARLRT